MVVIYLYEIYYHIRFQVLTLICASVIPTPGVRMAIISVSKTMPHCKAAVVRFLPRDDHEDWGSHGVYYEFSSSEF
jgi:hypothetical protein